MLRNLIRKLDWLLGSALWIAMLAMTLCVLWQVFTRFVLHNPSSWTEELAIYLLIWIGLLGAPVALKRKSHLGIDILVNKLPERQARAAAIFVWLCIIFFSMGVLVFGGIRLVQVILTNRQISPALHIRVGYTYLVLPISGLFMTLYALEFLVADLKAFLGRGRDGDDKGGIRPMID